MTHPTSEGPSSVDTRKPFSIGVNVRGLVRFLVKQRITGLDAPTEPHFDPEATKEFERHLRTSRSYLEFGCGGSTMLADRLGIPTVSVESDSYYAQTVRRALRANTKVRVLSIDIGITREWGFPIFTRRTEARSSRWGRYSSAPWPLFADDGFPDFLLVDGRFRRACVLHATREAVARGRRILVMFDDYFTDSKRHYRSVEEFLGAPRRVGRAGFFELEPTAIAKCPSPEDISEANKDPR